MYGSPFGGGLPAAPDVPRASRFRSDHFKHEETEALTLSHGSIDKSKCLVLSVSYMFPPYISASVITMLQNAFPNPPRAARKGEGLVWSDVQGGKPPSNEVRIMEGKPLSGNLAQRVNYVLVLYQGQRVDKNGVLSATGGHANNPDSHIPLADYENWAYWHKPT